MERIYQTLSFGTVRCIGIVRTMAIFVHLICLRVLWWDVSVMWGQYLHHRHRDLQIRHLIWDYVFYCFKEMSSFFDNFDHRVRTTLSLSDFGLHCGSAITVVERLQRYNCIWLTYIENVEQNVLPQCRRFEAVRCYLCVESWFGDGTLCSNYVLYSEEGCTEYLVVNHFVLEKLTLTWALFG